MKLLVAIIFLVGAACAAHADSTEAETTYFHPAASLYIHGDTVAASNLVAQGLAQYPKDAKLLRLKELLEQQQQEQQQQEQEQQQQEQEQQEQEQQQQDQGQPQDQQQEQEHQEDQQQEQQQSEPQPRPAAEMTPDEARQLMEAMKQEEKNKRMLLRPVMGHPIKVDKDW